MNVDLLFKICDYINYKNTTQNQYLCIDQFNITIKTDKGLLLIDPLLGEQLPDIKDFAEINFLDKLL